PCTWLRRRLVGREARQRPQGSAYERERRSQTRTDPVLCGTAVTGTFRRSGSSDGTISVAPGLHTSWDLEPESPRRRTEFAVLCLRPPEHGSRTSWNEKRRASTRRSRQEIAKLSTPTCSPGDPS